MKFVTFRFLFILIVVSLLIAPTVKAAPASGDSYVFGPPYSGSLNSCNGNGFTVFMYVTRNISSSAKFDSHSTLNGIDLPGVVGLPISPVHDLAPVKFFVTHHDFTTNFPTGQTGIYTLVGRFVVTSLGTGEVISDSTFTFICNTSTLSGTWNVVPTPSSPLSVSSCVFPDAGDGRLNSLCADAAQTATFYCPLFSNTQALSVFAVWSSKGYEQFKVTQAELDKFPSTPTKNTLIKAGKYASLYRLTTGELQVNTYTGDAYVFPGSPATIAQICGSVGKAYYKIDAKK